jgi:hypothetical protein
MVLKMNFSRLYGGFCVSMGLYGFTRGFRSETESKRLITDKLAAGFFNSLMYSAPIVNLWPLTRLVNRLEIDYNDLEKKQYQDSFRELVGDCYDTI